MKASGVAETLGVRACYCVCSRGSSNALCIIDAFHVVVEVHVYRSNVLVGLHQDRVLCRPTCLQQYTLDVSI